MKTALTKLLTNMPKKLILKKRKKILKEVNFRERTFLAHISVSKYLKDMVQFEGQTKVKLG